MKKENWIVKHKKINGHDGQYFVIPENQDGILNPDKIISKLMFYTTQGGYDFCHPHSRAKAVAVLIAEAPNIKEKRDGLLEALIEIRDLVDRHKNNEYTYSGQAQDIAERAIKKYC